MVWFRVMMPQNTTSAQNAGMRMAAVALTPPDAATGSAPSAASPAPRGRRPFSSGFERTTNSVNGRVPTSVMMPKTVYARRQPSLPDWMRAVPTGLKMTPPMPVNAMQSPTKKPTRFAHHALMSVGTAR